MGNREITYSIDKQGKPALLSQKESIAQQLINALFLIEGNVPNIPIGVDIDKYLYSKPSEVLSLDIEYKLKMTCGEEFMSDNISSVDCGVVDIEGTPYFWLSVHLLTEGDDEDNTLALVLTKQNDTVTFNYQFLNDGIKKAYGISE